MVRLQHLPGEARMKERVVVAQTINQFVQHFARLVRRQSQSLVEVVSMPARNHLREFAERFGQQFEYRRRRRREMKRSFLIIFVHCDFYDSESKSNQPRFGHPTAEGAEVRRAKVILNNLCDPAAPSAVGSLVPMLCGPT